MREGGRRPRERCDRVPSGMPQWTVLGSTSFPGAAECGRARAAALCAERRPSFCWNLDMTAGASAALRTGMPGNKTGAQLQSVGPTQAPWPPARLCEAGAVAAVSLGGEPRPLTAAGCQPPLSAAEGAVITTARAERRLHSTRVPGSTSTGVVAPAKPRASPAAVGASQLLDGAWTELLVQHRLPVEEEATATARGSWAPRRCVHRGWWVLTLLTGSQSQDEGTGPGREERSPGKCRNTLSWRPGDCWGARLS